VTALAARSSTRRALTARSGRGEFSMNAVVQEMRRRGIGYAESTVRTVIASHLCADATGPGVAGYTDLQRTSRGTYRLSDSRRPAAPLKP
jgi:hypothetical protein